MFYGQANLILLANKNKEEDAIQLARKLLKLFDDSKVEPTFYLTYQSSIIINLNEIDSKLVEDAEINKLKQDFISQITSFEKEEDRYELYYIKLSGISGLFQNLDLLIKYK